MALALATIVLSTVHIFMLILFHRARSYRGDSFSTSPTSRLLLKSKRKSYVQTTSGQKGVTGATLHQSGRGYIIQPTASATNRNERNTKTP
jgi:hypothetical protein